MESYRSFVERNWSLYASGQFVPGWHIDAVCSAVEEALGTGRGLVINMPPMHMGSTLGFGMLAAYALVADPDCRPCSWTYADGLATQHGRVARRVVDALALDVHRVGSFSLRDATTGTRANPLVVDTPHAVNAETKHRERMNNRWLEVILTRRPPVAPWIVIEYRQGENDLTAALLDQRGQGKFEFEHLVLPAEYEHDHPNGVSHRDVRRSGEMLWPVRDYESIRRCFGPFAWSWMWQQRAPKKVDKDVLMAVEVA